MNDEPTPIYRRDDGRLEDDAGEIVICSWFALCDRPAVDVEPHPILGGVPVCQRCADRIRA